MSALEREFPRQFLVSRGPRPLPPKFRSFPLPNGWVLAVDEQLQVVEIRGGEGATGWLLGDPIDREAGTMVRGALDIEGSLVPGFEALSNAVMDRLAGSFLFLLTIGEETRIFLDADASMGLVYDPATQGVAASAELLLGDAYFDRLEHGLVAAFDARRDGWFTAGLTAHRGVYRLLPNHALSLSTFAASRHWPAAMPAYDHDTRTTIRAIGEEVARSTAAIIADGCAVSALTGGFETRALLAANRENRKAMQWVTVAAPGSALDLDLARRLSRMAGIDHRVLPATRATEAQQDAWTRGAGHAMAGMNKVYHPAVAPLAGQTLVGGLGGEVGRGFLWPADLTATTAIDAQYLLNRLKLPQHPLLLERVGVWLDGVPEGLDSFQLLDLAYVELRMGPWAFAQPYDSGGPTSQHPLISRAQFTRMWSLPPEFRAGSGMMRALVAEFWPELGTIPINAYGDWRDRLEILGKLVRRPDRAWRKARQIVRERVLRDPHG